MKITPIFIALERDCWRVFVNGENASDSKTQPVTRRVAFTESQGPLSVAHELAKELGELGYIRQEVCLGLDSSFVYSVTIECDDLPRRQRQQMLLYRIEEQLPLAAEELTAVFLPSLGGRCLALAVESENFGKIISGLSDVGIEVGPICPAALLALWVCLQSSDVNPNYVIFCNGAAMELFRVVNGVPHDWYSSKDDTNLLNSLRVSLLNYQIENNSNASALIVGQLDTKTLSALEREIPVQKIEADENFFDGLATQGAEFLFSGKPAGWIDFRTGKLARKKIWKRSGGLIRVAIILSLLLVVTMSATFIVRGLRYDGLASNYHREQNEAYRKLYQGQKIPRNITTRLESELRRLSGVLGHGQDVPEAPKALDELHALIKNLPDKIRFRIFKIQIEQGGITLEGQVKTHSDAEAIVQSLNRGGLEALAPRTERLASGDVSFVITAKPVLEKTVVAGKGAKL